MPFWLTSKEPVVYSAGVVGAVGLTSEQMRAWPRMGSKQHLACWPWAAQVSMKPLMLVGVTGAAETISSWGALRYGRRRLTRSAVQVGEVQDISRAADGVAGAAEAGLALFEGSGHGGDGESEDGGEEHVDGLVWWVV